MKRSINCLVALSFLLYLGNLNASAQGRGAGRSEGRPPVTSPALSQRPDFERRIEQNGFKNQGQLIAALHASQNLGIPFADLKAKMTGMHPMSLGEAIHALKPNMPEKDVAKEARKAVNQASATAKAKPKPIR